MSAQLWAPSAVSHQCFICSGCATIALAGLGTGEPVASPAGMLRVFRCPQLLLGAAMRGLILLHSIVRCLVHSL